MKFKLNERNAGHVMNIINTFFKKTTGLKKEEVIETKPIFDQNNILVDMERIVHTNVLIPVLGYSCTFHHMRKEKPMFFKNPILSIVSKYNGFCIPLSEDDIIITKGSRLIIKQIFKHDPKWFNSKPITMEFVHTQYSEIELKNEYIKLLYDVILDDLFASKESLSYDDEEVKEHIYKIEDALLDYFSIPSTFQKRTTIRHNPYKLILVRNLELFETMGYEQNSNGENIFHYEVIDLKGKFLNKSNSVMELVSFLMENESQLV